MTAAATHMLLFSYGQLPISSAYVTNAKDETDLATYSFASQSIGAAAADRIVVVGVFFNAAGSVTISSCTIDGNAATQIVQALNDTGAATTGCALYALRVPSGTTATIAFTLSASAVRAGIGIWTISGKPYGVAPFHTASATSGDPATVSLNIPFNGCVIACGAQANAGTVAVTWSGATEDFDQVMGTSDNTMTGAHTAGPTGASTGASISADWASAPSRPALCAASWGPG